MAAAGVSAFFPAAINREATSSIRFSPMNTTRVPGKRARASQSRRLSSLPGLFMAGDEGDGAGVTAVCQRNAGKRGAADPRTLPAPLQKECPPAAAPPPPRRRGRKRTGRRRAAAPRIARVSFDQQLPDVRPLFAVRPRQLLQAQTRSAEVGAWSSNRGGTRRSYRIKSA